MGGRRRPQRHGSGHWQWRPHGHRPELRGWHAVSFAFTVTFPDGGVPTGPANGDNLLKNLNATPTYVFTAISD